MYDHFEVYPPNEDRKIQWDVPYFVEITRWEKGKPMQWRLFQRSFIFSREDWEKQIKKEPNGFAATLMSPEGHPYQLGNGTVNEYPNVIAMETPTFLKFMVDALNEKYLNDMNDKEFVPPPPGVIFDEPSSEVKAFTDQHVKKV